MKKSTKQHCPFCGELAYHHQIKPVTLHYKKQAIIIDQPGFWCDACQEGVIGGDDRKATQKALQTQRAEIDGLLTPDQIKRIREKLKLTQHKAALLFGGGINAFSRYERGETPLPKSLHQLLILLDKHPTLAAELSHAKFKHAGHA
jgi:HTH-type transcriptional regulator/antitoxin MqsA